MAANLDILIRAIDEASGPLSKVGGGLDKLDKKAKSATSGFGGLKTAMGTGLKVAGGLAAVGLGAFAVVLNDGVSAAREAVAIEKQLDAVLKSTGGAAGVTKDAVLGLANSLSTVTNFEDDAIVSGENLLLTFTNIGKDVFPAATETMLDMSQALGQDMKSSAVQLGKALNDPVVGITALSRVGVSFTDQQKEMIAAMVEAGDVAGAQQVILAELGKEFGGSARALADPAIQLQNAWGNFKEELGKAVLPLLNDLAKKVLPLVITAIERLPEVIDWFVKVAVPAFQEVAAAVGAFINFVKPLFTAFGSSVDKEGTQRFAYFKEWIDTNLPLIKTLVENIMNALSTFWTNHGEAVMTVATNLLTVATAIFDTGLKNILDIVTLALQLLTGDWEGAGETLQGIVTRTWDMIKQIFSLQLDSIKALFTDFDWSSLGTAMMEGIANGIRNAGGLIRDAATDAARNAFEAAKGFLRIGSPSKLFAGMGENMMAGMAQGINQRAYQPATAALSAAKNITTTFAEGAVPITVNVAGGGYDNGVITGSRVSSAFMREMQARGI